MLGIVTGGVMAFMALLILSLIVLCLMQKNSVKTFGEVSVMAPFDVFVKQRSSNMTPDLVFCFTDEPVEILMTKKR